MIDGVPVADRIARLRRGTRLPTDLEWLRATVETGALGWAVGNGRPAQRLICDCRCDCHAGPCGIPIDVDVLDCGRSCRSAHILASDCSIDKLRREAVGV